MKIRNINIEQADNGYSVAVGCKRLVFQDRHEVVKELGRYLENPTEVEAEYAKRHGWSNEQIPDYVPDAPLRNLGSATRATEIGTEVYNR